MRYYYEKPEKYTATKARRYNCNHPLYNVCTLYLDGDKGLAVIQPRFNEELKSVFWSAIDPWLIDDIYQQKGFKKYFKENAAEPHGSLYPTVSIRQIMWALRMKPLKKEFWEAYSSQKKQVL